LGISGNMGRVLAVFFHSKRFSLQIAGPSEVPQEKDTPIRIP
jgi:hypothetical protein